MDTVSRLAEEIGRLSALRSRVLVGVDGPDAAGKSSFADLLATAVTVPTVRVGVDGFLQPTAKRYRRGDLSPEGYYHDAFDYRRLLDECLVPFLGGAGTIGAGVDPGDARADRAPRRRLRVPLRSALIVDGVFLLRPDLRPLWTISVYLRVSPAECLRRAELRDVERLGSVDEVRRRYEARYLPGQELYRAEADPQSAAHVLVDHETAGSFVVERWSVPASP